MKKIKAIKTQIVELIPVTGEELTFLSRLNNWISISEHDKVYTDFYSKEIVGYIAGEIDKLKTDLLDESDSDTVTPDGWFINKAFFDANYKEEK